MRKLLAFAFLLALFDLSLSLTNERKQELLQMIQKMTPKERKTLNKVLDFEIKHKEYKEKEEEEEEKLRNLQSTDDTTDGEGTPLNTNGTSNPKAALQFLDFSGYNYDKIIIHINR